MRILSWAKTNILKWTILVTVFTFLVGPFAQEMSTGFLKRTFTTEGQLEIYVCSPLRSSTLLVSSFDGSYRKTHSSSRFPFLQQVRVAVVNDTGKPVPESSVYLAPINQASNYIAGARFFSNNNLSKENYHVSELPENAFRIELGNFVSDQVLILEFETLLPTSVVVEFAGETESNRRIVNAGDCDIERAPSEVSHPVDFYSKESFSEIGEKVLFGEIQEIINPVGEMKFEIVLDYDCGEGPERQTVPLGSPVEYCHMQFNMH